MLRIRNETFVGLFQEVIDPGIQLLRARYGTWALLRDPRTSVEFIPARDSSGLPAFPPSISSGRVRELLDMPRPLIGMDKTWGESFLSIPLPLRDWTAGLLYAAEKEGAHRFEGPDIFLGQILVRIMDELVCGNKTTIEIRRCIRFMHEMLNESSITCITDAARTIVFWSRGAQNFFGYTEREALGQSIVSLLVPPEQQPKFKRGYYPGIHGAIVRGNIAHFSSDRLHKDGRRIYASTIIHPFCYEITGIAVCVCFIRFEPAA